MRTTSITCWWTCSGCGTEAELTDGDYAGYAMPCPDCDDVMVEWIRWDTAAIPAPVR